MYVQTILEMGEPSARYPDPSLFLTRHDQL